MNDNQTSNERAEFEQWLQLGIYKASDRRVIPGMWDAWQAARGAHETSAPRALAFGDEVTYAPLYDSKLPREGWKVEVLPKLTYVIKHPNGSLIAVDAGEINAVEPS